MAFPKEIADAALVLCERCCCVCHKYCGGKIALHHIMPQANGGDNSLENCIPLCFDCHAEVGHYNIDHPIGRKFSADELRAHRDNWHRQVQSLNGTPDPPSIPTVQSVPGNHNIVAGRDITIAAKVTRRVEIVTDPGGRHITDAEALRVRQAVAKYTDLMKAAGLDPNPSIIWGKLYAHFQITSYKEIPFGMVDAALKIINAETGKARPKIRRRNPDLWRNQYYTAIYATANAIQMSKEEVYRFAQDVLTLEKPIQSLKELTQRQLQDLDRKIKAKKPS